MTGAVILRMVVGVVPACMALVPPSSVRMEARVVRSLPGGGWMVAGGMRNPGRGDEDILVLHLSRGGTVRWARVFGSSRQEEIRDGVATRWGTVWVGMAEQPPRTRAAGASDALAFSLDERGGIRWVRLWGGPGEDVATAVAVGPEGRIWVAGFSFRRVDGANLPHLFVAVLHPEDGRVLLSRRFRIPHASAWLRPRRMVPDPSGGFWLLGEISPKGKEDADLWVVRLDGEGMPRGMIRLVGEGRQMARDGVPDGEGGVFILGNVRRFRGSLMEKDDLLLLHMDGKGEVSWMLRLGTPGVDNGEGVVRIGDRLLGVGWTRGVGGRGEGLLFEVDAAGTTWRAWTLGGSREDRLRAVATRENRWMAAGWTLSYGTPPFRFTPSLWVVSGEVSGKRCHGCGTPVGLRAYPATYRMVSVAFSSEWRWPAWLARWLSPDLQAALEPLIRWVYRKGETAVFGEGREETLAVRSLALIPYRCDGAQP